MAAEFVKTRIIGGGQAGLTMRHMRSKRGRPHLVLERSRIAERWRSERWDGLYLPLPNWFVSLPDFPLPHTDPDAFSPNQDVVDFVAAAFQRNPGRYQDLALTEPAVRSDADLGSSPAKPRTTPGRPWRRSSAAPTPRATGAPMKTLLRHPVTQALLASLLSLYLGFALRTTRWRLDGGEHLGAMLAHPPAVVAFWHERLPLMPILWLRAQKLPEGARARVHILASSHRDGRFIGAVMRRFHVSVVLGSSTRGGARGLRNLLDILRRGELVVITPDGPRGPARQPAFGVAQLAALSGVPVLPCAAQTSRRWVLPSWDGMVVPKPFGRGVVVCGPLIDVPRAAWQDAVPAIGAALTAAAERADRLCLA